MFMEKPIFNAFYNTHCEVTQYMNRSFVLVYNIFLSWTPFAQLFTTLWMTDLLFHLISVTQYIICWSTWVGGSCKRNTDTTRH